MRLCQYRVRNYQFNSLKKRWVIHTIREKDTLYQLAREYKTSVLNLLQHNPSLDPRQLIINDQIIFPLSLRDCKTHYLKFNHNL